MNFNDYQEQAHRTANYPEEIDLLYATIGLSGEVGEYANQVKKVWRDDKGIITPERRQKMLDELCDVLWYVSEVSTVLDAKLNDVAIRNLAKLANREKTGTIHGDNRNERNELSVLALTDDE